MHRRQLLGLMALGLVCLAQRSAGAQEDIYGAQLMTRQEREAYRRDWRALKTPAERAQFRDDHVKAMQRRAHEQGIMLRDELPPGAHGPSTPIKDNGG